MRPYTIMIVLVHAVLAVHANPFHRTHSGNNIKALCDDKPIALRTVDELEELNELAGDSKCSSHLKTAIADLSALINQTKGDLCAQESIDKLRTFYAKYLDTSCKDNKKREQLPKSLKKFALALGMQMSGLCKRRMVNVLTGSRYHKRPSDGIGHYALFSGNKVIAGLVSDKSPVAEMLKGLTGPDEILLPGDLAPYLRNKHDADIGDDKIYVQTATAPYMRTLQEECNKKYAPIYRPLIKPIVQLTNMGFNYKDAPLRFTMNEPKVSKELAQWARLVFLCESLNSIRVIDVLAATADANDSAGKTMRILTGEEARALDITNVSEPEVVERTYEPMILDEVIYDKENFGLKKAIKAFSTSKSEDERVAKRMLGKGISMFKTQVKRHNIGLLLSTGSRALAHRIKTGQNLKVDVSSEIVKVLDGVIGHEEEYLAEDKWEAAKEIAQEIGATLAMTVLGIIFIGFWALLVGVIAAKLIAMGFCAVFAG